MEAPNIGWQYYVDYYRGVDFSYLLEPEVKYAEESEAERKERLHRETQKRVAQFQRNTATILGSELDRYPIGGQTRLGRQFFLLSTTYPGLLMGTGYRHEVKVEQELKLGFYFDHTWGLPVIPGSSIKGLLRSKWPGWKEGGPDAETVADQTERAAFIRWVAEKANERIQHLGEGGALIPVETMDAGHLELAIFEGVDVEATLEKHGPEGLCNRKRWVHLPASQKDVFYEAILHTSSGTFFERDYITPHMNRELPELSPFTNPVPLQFLKVKAGIEFRFQFDLKDGLLSAQQKLALFQELLLTLGIGAKTNVGYGQLMVPAEYQEVYAGVVADPSQGQGDSGRGKPPVAGTKPETKIPKAAFPLLRKNSEWAGRVDRLQGEYYVLQVQVGGNACTLIKRKTEQLSLEAGQSVKIRFNADASPGEIPNFKVY